MRGSKLTCFLCGVKIVFVFCVRARKLLGCNVWIEIDLVFSVGIEIDLVFVYGPKNNLFLVCGSIDLVSVWVVEIGLVFV